jgi:hypothetical protein
METDLESLVGAGVGTNRLENGGPSVIASLQLGAVLLYVIPRTSVLGVVILTGYLGGAIATYVRIGGTVSPAGPAPNGAARLAGDLSAREASTTVASDPHANAKVELD